jgi:hypothetical protein
MGHDVNNCWSLQLMKEHTADAYWVQEENKGGDHGGFDGEALTEEATKEAREEDMEEEEEEDMVEEEDHLPILTVVR